MNYIINPSVFYWMNVLAIAQTVFGIFGGFMFITGTGLLVFYALSVNDLEKPTEPKDKHSFEYSRYESDLEKYNYQLKKLKTTKRWMIPLLVISSILIIAAIFIPGKTASVEMLVAKTATFENVDWSVAQIKEIIDYITNALKSVV